MRLKENWQNYSLEETQDFLRVGHEGRGHPSRSKSVALLEGMKSVLDVGCGSGVMFELIGKRWPAIDYLGIDVTESLLEVARQLFPADAGRFQRFSLYDLNTFPRKFDAVICRHVLEHLPDYMPAVQSMYSCATRKLMLIFFLPPTLSPFRRKKDERFEKGFYFHTYDLGRFFDQILNGLYPPPREIRIHPRQGYSDPTKPWGDRQNIIYEVMPPEDSSPVDD